MVKLTVAPSLLTTLRPVLTPPARTEAERSRARYAANPWRGWYGLKVWRDLRRLVMRRDGMQCQETGVLLTTIPNRPTSAIVDHICDHKGDWSLFTDPDNLQLVSKAWHDSKKQAADRARPLGIEGGGG